MTKPASTPALMFSTALCALCTLLPPPSMADAFGDAMESAFKTNPRIQTERRTAEQSNEQASQAIAAFRPSLSATYQRGKQKNSYDGSSKDTTNFDSKSLSLTQPIFMGGQNIYNYYASKDRMFASWAFLNAAEQNVLIDAVVAYMDVVQNHSLLELSSNNVNVLKKQLEASQDRFSVGDVTRTDVAQSEARLARAKADEIQAEGDLEVALASFERTIGFRPENLPLPLPQSIPPLPANMQDGVEYALKHNPNIIAAQHIRSAADNDAGVATGSILPKVSLQGEISRQDGAGVFGTSTYDSDQLLLNVSIPIYQNGSEYSQVREAELVAKQRGFEMQDTQDNVREALIKAWETYQTAIATIEAQQGQVEASQIALDGVRQENQYGSRSVLDVLDAEQELFIANESLVRAQRNRYVSLYNLLLVLGELTPEKLALNVERYDPKQHYDSVKWQLIGF